MYTYSTASHHYTFVLILCAQTNGPTSSFASCFPPRSSDWFEFLHPLNELSVHCAPIWFVLYSQFTDWVTLLHSLLSGISLVQTDSPCRSNRRWYLRCRVADILQVGTTWRPLIRVVPGLLSLRSYHCTYITKIEMHTSLILPYIAIQLEGLRAYHSFSLNLELLKQLTTTFSCLRCNPWRWAGMELTMTLNCLWS